jgi:transposase
MKEAKVLKSLGQRRIFSDPLKRKIVKDIEHNKASISTVCREYQVCSQTVYNWLNKYSRHLQSGQNLVIQMESEQYRSKELEKKVAELEAAVGRKQMEIDFLNKLIEVAGDELKVDLKKNFSTPPSGGSKPKAGNMDIK